MAEYQHPFFTASNGHFCSRQALVAHLELLYSAVTESDLRNFQTEQIFNSRGCLWPTRVLGPAPAVRFQLTSPIGKVKHQCGLSLFLLFLI